MDVVCLLPVCFFSSFFVVQQPASTFNRKKYISNTFEYIFYLCESVTGPKHSHFFLFLFFCVCLSVCLFILIELEHFLQLLLASE